jgi:hypothetical protein
MSPWTTGSSPVVTRWVLVGLYSMLNTESPDRSGKFHKTNRKHMPHYVAELQFRHNNRFNADIFGTAINEC